MNRVLSACSQRFFAIKLIRMTFREVLLLIELCVMRECLAIACLALVLVGCGGVDTTAQETAIAQKIYATQTANARLTRVASAPNTSAPTSTPTTTRTPNPTDTPTITPAPSPTSTPRPQVPNAPLPTPQRFTGRGVQATQKFNLEAGLTIIRWNVTRTVAGSFSFALLDSQGKSLDARSGIEVLVPGRPQGTGTSTPATFTGSQAVPVTASGIYLLNVSTDGTWSIQVEQRFATDDAPRAPLQLNGTGNQLSPFFQLSAGLAVFHFQHQGKSALRASLLDSRGSTYESFGTTASNPEGSKAVSIREAGFYLLDITADGSWMFSVER